MTTGENPTTVRPGLVQESEFLARVSHELRTPLSTVLGMLDLVLEGELTAEVRADLATTRDAAGVMRELLEDLLSYSRLHSGQVELHPAPFDPHALLQETVQALSLRAEDKGLALSLDIDRDTPEVIIADELRLRQVITNLVVNAVKFTDEGQVNVAVMPEFSPGGTVRLSFFVTDTGPGISEQDQAKIFAPFARVGGEHATEGVGLGLAIAGQLVRMMGGVLQVESEPGAGSTFFFGIDCRPSYRVCHINGETSPAPRVSRQDAQGPGQEPHRSLRILVVEDTAANQKIIVRMLERHNHEVLMASTGREACDRLREDPGIDLVLMDVEMPVMDGLEATSAIRQMEGRSGKHVPIVAMTAHAFPGDREQCLSAGMDAYVSKPIDMRQLLAVIDSLACSPARF